MHLAHHQSTSGPSHSLPPLGPIPARPAPSDGIESFVIDIPQAALDDLREPVRPDPVARQLPGDWDKGVPVEYLKGLADYWQHGYDWRAQEAELNEFPQFITEIDGQRVHFLHIRSAEPDATPLLLIHGWPVRSPSSST